VSHCFLKMVIYARCLFAFQWTSNQWIFLAPEVYSFLSDLEVEVEDLPMWTLWASRQAPTWRGPAIKQSPVFDWQTAELLEGQKPATRASPKCHPVFPPRTGTKRPSNKLENYEISWAPFTYESQFRESTLAALAFHKSNFSAGLAFNAPTKSYGYNHLKDLSLQISIDHNQKMSKTYLKSENKKKTPIFPSCHPERPSPHTWFFFHA